MPRSTPGTKLRTRLVLSARAARSELLTLQNFWQKYGVELKPEDDATRVREAWNVLDGVITDLVKQRVALGERYKQLLAKQQTETWTCGCLVNNADAHRVGCPDHPEGVKA